MGASRHIGRVGGLAVALGVGAAVFSVSGVAWADSGTDSSQPSGRSGRTSQSSAPSAASKSNSGNNSHRVGATAAKASTAAARSTASKPAPAPALTTAVRSSGATSTGGAAPSTPVTTDAPLLAALVELSRRAQPGGASQVASAVTSNGITVNPGVTYFDGIIQGNLNAVSDSGDELVFKALDQKRYLGKVDVAANDASDTAQVVPTSLDPFLPPDAKGGAGSFSVLPYANWIDPNNPTQNPIPTGTQTFHVRVSENTQFDKLIVKIPLVGLLASPIIGLLQQTPFVSTLLAPIIGGSMVAEIAISMDDLVPSGAPVAFTYVVDSWDGAPISANFFPASSTSLGVDNKAATLFNGPGLGSPGQTLPYASNQAAGSTPGLPIMRGQSPMPTGSGFNVITWDPRGEFQSGGILQLDNPFYEGRDVTALIDWAAANTPLQSTGGSLDIGMIGGSYGGAIQLTTVDPRIEAIVPTIAWNSLNQSLYPDKTFKTGWADTLFLALATTGARPNPLIPWGILTGNLFGWLGPSAQAALGSSGPTSLLTKLDAPSLYVQGTVDGLFPLQQAIDNAQTQLEQNPYFSGPNADQVKMIWFCGGHGLCLDPVDLVAQGTSIFTSDMTWLNTYVKDAPLPELPTFQWWDQAGTQYTSALLPFDPAFVSDSVSATGTGGRLVSLPFAIGGSGPNSGKEGDPNCPKGARACQWPFDLTFATPTKHGIDVNITVPDVGTQIVGAPTVSFTYSGVGTSGAVYGQIVDDATGRVLGNLVSPIPVTLDGKSHTVTADLSDIVYTSQAADSSLTLQLVGSASAYVNLRLGTVKISDISVDLPVTTAGTPTP